MDAKQGQAFRGSTSAARPSTTPVFPLVERGVFFLFVPPGASAYSPFGSFLSIGINLSFRTHAMKGRPIRWIPGIPWTWSDPV
eukprot:scaffold139_cov325-Pavlova_lutheri.AAC.44